jgi:hypothetical protein
MCILTAFLILFRKPKEASNRNAFYFILLMALWVADIFGQWTIHGVAFNMFVVRMSIPMVALILLFFLYFSYYFTQRKIELKNRLPMAVPCFILIILSFTNYAFDAFNISDCYYAEGKWISFFSYIIEIFYAIWASNVLLKYYHKPDGNLLIQNSIKFLVPALGFFVVWNIIFREIDRIIYIESTPHFITGTLFFISIIAFAIIKKDFFEFPVVITNHYTVVVWTLIFLGFLFFYSNLTLISLAVIFYIILMYIFWKM